uniref:CHK kinase-like domain-containing protein n=1 Tax=Panagrolaimus superbus TaxID=310955 RepID=A0A914YD96_9BILA
MKADITGGSAFFSQVITLNFEWNDSAIVPKSIVLKVPGIQAVAKDDDNTEDTEAYLEFCHENELIVYKFLLNCSKKFNTSLKIPNVYYGANYSRSHRNGLIIMDDLSVNGASLKLLPGLNNVQVENTIAELARIHALAWKSGKVREIELNSREDNFPAEMKQISQQLRSLRPSVFNKLLDKLDNIYNDKVFSYAVYNDETKFGFPPTLVHSDLWSSNILFEKKDNVITNNLLAIIDWQSGHPGNPCVDIGRLLAINTSVDYRRKNTEQLLKHYYEIICQEMDNKPPLTFDQLKYAYAAGMGYVTMFLTFGAPYYYNMPAVVGVDENRETLRKELLDRVQCFLEDTIEVYQRENITV